MRKLGHFVCSWSLLAIGMVFVCSQLAGCTDDDAGYERVKVVASHYGDAKHDSPGVSTYDNDYTFLIEVKDDFGSRTFHYEKRPVPTPKEGEVWLFYAYSHNPASKVEPVVVKPKQAVVVQHIEVPAEKP